LTKIVLLWIYWLTSLTKIVLTIRKIG